MREIKFRAWDNRQEKWIADRDLYMMTNGRVYAGDMDNPPIVHINQEFVSFSTGLRDVNGREIYEGDILKFEDCGEEGYEYKDGFDFTNMATVCFSEGRFELTNFQSDNSAVLEDMHGEDHETFILNFGLAEVAGNIYENPKLLEGRS